MKNIYISILVILFVVSFSLIKVNATEANTTVTDSTGKSSFTSTDVQEDDVFGMHHELVTGYTTTGGAKKQQLINEFEMKTDGYTSKLVTWCCHTTNYSFVKKVITAAARDYEKNNPGWIVVGGTNADQYFLFYGNDIEKTSTCNFQPSSFYPLVTNGDKLFTVTSAYNNWTNIIGIRNDGSTQDFAHPEGLAGFRLSVFDDKGNVIKCFDVGGINESLGANGTVIHIYEYVDGGAGRAQIIDVDTENNLYVVTNSHLAYKAMDADYVYPFKCIDSVFARGTIDSLDKKVSLDKGQFAIETTNQDVIDALDIGVEIKVEQIWSNEDMNNCLEGIGFHTVHKYHGVDQKSDAPYNTSTYSRSLIGKKADGTYVLITADYCQKFKSEGLNFEECNAVADYYGLTDMYQMDGGGSVTAMMRQPDGSFKVTNYPKDTSNPLEPRADFSYLFFVVRDPKISCDVDKSTYHSLTINKGTIDYEGEIKNIKVNCNGKDYDLTGDSLTIDGLIASTQYIIKVSYDLVIDGIAHPASIQLSSRTKDYSYPQYPIVLKERSKTHFLFKLTDSPLAKNISNIVIHVGDNVYTQGNDEFICDGLIEDTAYSVYYTYDIYDELTGITYSRKDGDATYKTLSYQIPKITKFEVVKKDNLVRINYQYSDPDGAIEEAFIYINDDIYPVTTRIGKLEINDLTLTECDYNIKLVLNHSEGSVESEVFTIEKEEKPNDEPTPIVDPAPNTKKKCGKKSAELIISIIGITTVISFILRKRH